MQKQIFSPLSLVSDLPNIFSDKVKAFRQTATDLVQMEGPLALIVGPCSISDVNAAYRFAENLASLQSDDLFLVMRAFVEKPRSKGGWKGYLYDPYLDGSHQIEDGIRKTRELFLAITEMGVPIAMEFLEPLTLPYLADLVTWGFIGARTSESQVHRQIASSQTMPIGFKNRTDGDIDVAIHGALSARTPHTYLSIDESGHIITQETKGNPNTHIVLRGGLSHTNYDAHSVNQALWAQSNLGTRLLIDCAHGNCQKDPARQAEVFRTVLAQNNPQILGLMLESSLTRSLTDPTLDWPTTASLIQSATLAHSS